MTRLSGMAVDEPMLALRQREFNEAQAVNFLQSTINDGRAQAIVADLDKLDMILGELGLQDSDEDPVAVIRARLGSVR